jgi:hypothetical protein
MRANEFALTISDSASDSAAGLESPAYPVPAYPILVRNQIRVHVTFVT